MGRFLYFIGDHLLSARLCNAQVLLTLVASPYLYTDKVSDFVQEASTLQATATKQDADDTSIPVSHIDGQCRSVSVLGSAVHGGGTLDQDMRSRPRGANERPLRGVEDQPSVDRKMAVCPEVCSWLAASFVPVGCLLHAGCWPGFFTRLTYAAACALVLRRDEAPASPAQPALGSVRL